eukprot:442428_1
MNFVQKRYTAFLDYIMTSNNETVKVKNPVFNDVKDDIQKSNPFIICPGLARSGTTSLKKALSILGFSCYNSEVAHNYYVNTWLKLLETKSELKKSNNITSVEHWQNSIITCDWDRIFNTNGAGNDDTVFNCCIGTPTNAFFLEIMEFYAPNYKVILTVSDSSAKWYNSAHNTVYKIFLIMNSFVFFLSPKWAAIHTFHNNVYSVLFMDNLGNEDYSKQKYEEWVTFIQKNVPKDKLLVFSCKKGWAPLCDFLGKKVPINEPFPHANTTKDMLKVVENATKARRIVLSAICVSALFVVVFYLMFISEFIYSV